MPSGRHIAVVGIVVAACAPSVQPPVDSPATTTAAATTATAAATPWTDTTPLAIGDVTRTQNAWRALSTDVDGDGCPDVVQAFGGDQAPQRLLSFRGACAYDGDPKHRVATGTADAPTTFAQTTQRTTALRLADVAPANLGPEIVVGIWSGGCGATLSSQLDAGARGAGVAWFRHDAFSMWHPKAPKDDGLDAHWLLPAYGVRTVDVADLSGDGRIDLLVAGRRDDDALSGWVDPLDPDGNGTPGPGVLDACLRPPPSLAWYAEEAAASPPRTPAAGSYVAQVGLHRARTEAPEDAPYSRIPLGAATIDVPATGAPLGTPTIARFADVDHDGFLDAIVSWATLDTYVLRGGADARTLARLLASLDPTEATLAGDAVAACGDGSWPAAKSSAFEACRLSTGGTSVFDAALVHVDGGDDAGAWLAAVHVCAPTETGDRCDPTAPAPAGQPPRQGVRLTRLTDGRTVDADLPFVPLGLAWVDLCTPAVDTTCPASGDAPAVVVGGARLDGTDGGALAVVALDDPTPRLIDSTSGLWGQSVLVVDLPPPKSADIPIRPTGTTTGAGRVVALPGPGPYTITSVTADGADVPPCGEGTRPCQRLRHDGRTVEVVGDIADAIEVAWSGAAAQDLILSSSASGTRSVRLPDGRAVVARSDTP